MPGYCSRRSFRASLFSSDRSATAASRGIDRSPLRDNDALSWLAATLEPFSIALRFPLLRKRLSRPFPAAIAAGVQFTAVAACRMFNPLLSDL